MSTSSPESSEALSSLLIQYPTIAALQSIPGIHGLSFNLIDYTPPQEVEVRGLPFKANIPRFALNVSYTTGEGHQFHYNIRSIRPEDFDEPILYDRALAYDSLIVDEATIVGHDGQQVSLRQSMEDFLASKGKPTPIKFFLRGDLPIFKMVVSDKLNLNTLNGYLQDDHNRDLLIQRLCDIDTALPTDRINGTCHAELPFVINNYIWHILATSVIYLGDFGLEDANAEFYSLEFEYLEYLFRRLGMPVPSEEIIKCIAYENPQLFEESLPRIHGNKRATPEMQLRELAKRLGYSLETLKEDSVSARKSYEDLMEIGDTSFYLTMFSTWRMWKPDRS